LRINYTISLTQHTLIDLPFIPCRWTVCQYVPAMSDHGLVQDDVIQEAERSWLQNMVPAERIEAAVKAAWVQHTSPSAGSLKQVMEVMNQTDEETRRDEIATVTAWFMSSIAP
jgi:hypothetical protein